VQLDNGGVEIIQHLTPSKAEGAGKREEEHFGIIT
jgi:hypothetical protein